MTEYKSGDMLCDATAADNPMNEEYIILLTRERVGWLIWSSADRFDNFLFDNEIITYYKGLNE